MGKKTNLQIELECALNWLQVYAEMIVHGEEIESWKIWAMRARVRDLRRRIAGKYNDD